MLPTSHVLLLEPHPALRAEVTDFLVEQGSEVSQHTSLRTACETAPRDRPVLALVDWRQTDGLLTQEGRAELNDLASKVPLVLMVPYRWLRLLHAEDFGVAAILPKPFDSHALHRVLHDALTGAGERVPVST